MAVRAPGDFDPATGWPPDDSTGIDWQNDVEIPGQFKGGGAGFGPGGFRGSPKLTAPASGPAQGLSLSNDGGGGTFDPRSSSAFRGPRWGGNPPPGFDMNSAAPTNAAGMGPHVNPATGQPEMLTGPGGLVEKTRGAMNPFGFIGGGNPYWRGALAAGGVLTPTPAETGEFNPAMITGRPDAPMGGVHGLPAAAPATYPHMPWPDTGVAPAAAPRASAPVAGPAAARQRPNLGTYGAPPAAIANSPFTTLDYRPNSGPNERNRGSPQATALDLSRLFGGGQPAPAAAAPGAAPRPAPAAPVDTTSNAPWGYGPIQQGNVWKPGGTRTPSGRRKSSSTS